MYCFTYYFSLLGCKFNESKTIFVLIYLLFCTIGIKIFSKLNTSTYIFFLLNIYFTKHIKYMNLKNSNTE